MKKYILVIVLITIVGAVFITTARAGLDILSLEIQSGVKLTQNNDAKASGGTYVEFGQSSGSAKPPLVIYDTDMGPDIDDAVALAMLHAYASAGDIEIAAVGVSRDSPQGARYTDAVNTFYGRPDIPIGVYRGGTVVSNQANNNGFTHVASGYPHDVHNQDIPNAYEVYRQVMVRAKDEGRELIVIQTGFSGNLSALMNSGPDSISPLDGIQLTKESIDVLSIMAGKFGSNSPEFNVEKDLSSAINLFNKWPVKMIVSDWRVGAGMFYPYDRGIKNNIDGNHPVRKAYESATLGWHIGIETGNWDGNFAPYGHFPGKSANNGSRAYNMASWDLTSVIRAIEPDAGYFSESGKGTVQLNSAGVSTFSENGGQHTILYVPDDKQPAISRMIELVK